MGFIIAGVILILIGIIFFFIRKSKLKQIFTIKAIPQRTVADLTDMAKTISAELGGSGSYNEKAKLSGKIVSDNSLRSELAKEPCVYYDMRIERKFEEKVRREDSNGKVYYEWVSYTETLSENTRSCDFYIDDGTGKIKISLDNCKFETIEVIDRFEPADDNRNELRIGDFSLQIPNFNSTSSRRTVGYIYTEHIIPLNSSAFIVGRVDDSSGELTIREPQDEIYSYIFSLKDEHQYLKEAKSSANAFKYISLGSLVIGAGLLITGLIDQIF